VLSLPDSDFNRDPRRQQELRARPLCDAIYAEVFGCDPAKIMRYDGHAFFDRQLGIDVGLRLSNGMALRGQEKALSFEFAHFNSLTVEYYQNQYAREPGDWFNIGAQFYFCGYLNQTMTAFVSYALVDWPLLALASAHGEVRWDEKPNRDGHARASFRYINFDLIPAYCLIARSFSSIPF